MGVEQKPSSLDHLSLIERRLAGLPTWAQAFLTDRHSEYHLSAASPWEIAIKSRLGKLRLKPRLDALPDFLVSLGITILSINERQAPTAIDPGRKHTIRLTGRL